MKKIYILSIAIIFISSFLVFSLLSQASTFADINKNIETQGQTAGYETGSDYTVIIGQIIKTALSVVGLLFVALIVYGGFLWMTAETGAGRNQLEKAKKVFIMAVIGLLIIVAAYAITSLVLTTIESESEPIAMLIK
jgi:hypothetical protein